MNSFIKRCRENAGLTQAQLAEKSNVSVATVQNWENGRAGIKPERYFELSEIFNVPVEDFIMELLIDADKKRPDVWPAFLFDDDTNAIVDTLHLNLSQQDLFGLLYIFGAEYMAYELGSDANDFQEDLKRIPYEYIARVGSIRFMNQAEGLYKVIKYVKTDFLMKVLKLNPESEFNIRKLSKTLICEFIDTGNKEAVESDHEYDQEESIVFKISMKKAKVMLPILDKLGPIHLVDGRLLNPVRADIPEELLEGYISCMGYNRELLDSGYYESSYNVINIIDGLQDVTDYKNVAHEGEEEKWMWSINRKGKELLKWFNE